VARVNRRALVATAVAVVAGCATGEPEPHSRTDATYRLDLRSGSRGVETPVPPIVGALPPGSYAPATFRLPMSFDVEAGWALAYETPEHMLLFFGDPDLPGAVYLFSVSPDTRVTSTPVADYGEVAPASEPFPDDYEAWLRGVPRIEVGPRRATEIGGARGFAVDVELGGLPAGACNSAEFQCFFPVELTAFSSMHDANSMTVHLVDTDGSEVLVITDGDRYREEIAALLESIRWDPDE
jgi:hypothetical protein